MATAFAIITFTLPVTAIAIAAIPRPVPDSFLQYAGYDAYRVPSVFTQRHGDGEPGEGASVNVVYCDNNWSGYYSRLLADCRRASLSLSKRKITRTFDARYTLDRIWKIPREGDIITDLAALAEETDIVEGDGWTGYTASVGSRIAHAVLDSDNRLVLFGRCVPRGTLCFMVSQTPAGLLTFMHRDGSDFDYQRWKMQEAEILELLAAWREID